MRYSSETIRVLLILGAILVIVGAVMESIIPMFGTNGHGGQLPDAASWIGPIVLIIVSILVFVMVGVLHVRNASIPMNALIMVVFLALEIILGGASFWSITGIGLIIEIVATTLLAAGE